MSEITIPGTGEMREIIVKEEGKLTIAKDVIEAIKEIKLTEKKVKEEYKKFSQQLVEAMEEYGVEKINAEGLKVAYVKPHTQLKLDSKKVEELFPEVYDACTKESNVKASVRVSV